MTREREGTLQEALRDLEGAARHLRRAGEHSLVTSLSHLQDVVASLGLATAARPPQRSEEYVQEWQRSLVNPQQELSPRALRYLCWEPEVATDSRFQDYIDRHISTLSARMLQGLVRSCHAHWPRVAVTVVRRVWQRLADYRGTHRVLVRWRAHATMIMHPSGHEEFAQHLLSTQDAIKVFCETWAVEERSLYVLDALRQAVSDCRERLAPEPALRAYLLDTLLPWTGWPVQAFHQAVGATILHPVTAQEPTFQEALTRLVLADTRLGDPRLPSNTKNWLGVQKAQQQFLQWLSRADITFFFEHVLPDRMDPHGRKAFWLRYVRRVLMSRPLLNDEDEGRLRTTMQRLKEQGGHFGRLYGNTSAFLLDFGPIIVVEFSRPGNACYVYEKSVFHQIEPDFWAPKAAWRLKTPTATAARVVHRPGWSHTMASFLAHYGIRPV